MLINFDLIYYALILQYIEIYYELYIMQNYFKIK